MNAFKSFLIFVKISKLYSSLNGKGYIFTTRTTLNYLGLTCTTMFIHISKNFIFSAYYILKDITYVFWNYMSKYVFRYQISYEIFNIS